MSLNLFYPTVYFSSRKTNLCLLHKLMFIHSHLVIDFGFSLAFFGVIAFLAMHRHQKRGKEVINVHVYFQNWLFILCGFNACVYCIFISGYVQKFTGDVLFQNKT